MHHGDTEFAELGAFFDQELFTPRPQRLCGELFSGSRAYPANLGVNCAENRARHSIFFALQAPLRSEVQIPFHRRDAEFRVLLDQELFLFRGLRPSAVRDPNFHS
jgi:hypothetical protein